MPITEFPYPIIQNIEVAIHRCLELMWKPTAIIVSPETLGALHNELHNIGGIGDHTLLPFGRNGEFTVRGLPVFTRPMEGLADQVRLEVEFE